MRKTIVTAVGAAALIAVVQRSKRKPIMKSYFGRVWFGFGVQSMKTKRVERCWLQAVHPPYYKGTGVALRLGQYSLRAGTLRANSTYLENEAEGKVDVSAELEAVGWQSSEMEAEVIGAWESSERTRSATHRTG